MTEIHVKKTFQYTKKPARYNYRRTGRMAYHPHVELQRRIKHCRLLITACFKENDKKSRSLAWEALRNPHPVEDDREKEWWLQGHDLDTSSASPSQGGPPLTGRFTSLGLCFFTYDLRWMWWDLQCQSLGFQRSALLWGSYALGDTSSKAFHKLIFHPG